MYIHILCLPAFNYLVVWLFCVNAFNCPLVCYYVVVVEKHLRNMLIINVDTVMLIKMLYEN